MQTMKLEENKDGSYSFYCPGCKTLHSFGTSWKFNGDTEKPTFTPSLLVFLPERTYISDGVTKRRPKRTLCHLFLTAGELKYCSDSPHELSGKTVDLPNIDELEKYHRLHNND